MNARDIKNSMNTKQKGKRIYPKAPSDLDKIGKEEWNRLVNSLHITEKDIGLLTLTVNSFSAFSEFNTAIHTRIERDSKTNKIKTYKRTLSEYLETHNSSQKQVELVQMNKAQEKYTKSIKLLNDLCSLPSNSTNEENPIDNEEEELLKGLL